MNRTQGLYIFTVCQGERLYCSANLLLSVTVSGYMCGKLQDERRTEHRVHCVKEVVKKKQKKKNSLAHSFMFSCQTVFC